jgi:hypothetical protein
MTNPEPIAADWEPRRQLTLETAYRQSDRVRRWRRVSALAAIGAVAVLVGFGLWHTIAQIAAPKPVFSAEDGANILAPRYTDGQTYNLTAREAVRSGPVETAVAELAAPQWANEGGMTAEGRRGVWDPKQQALELYDDVKFATNDGSTFSSTRATVVAGERRIVGTAPIEGQSKLGFVRGDNYEIIDGGKRIKLTGRVRVIMREEPLEQPAGSQTAPLGADSGAVTTAKRPPSPATGNP